MNSSLKSILKKEQLNVMRVQICQTYIAAVVVVVDVAARLAVLGDLLQLLDEAIGTVRTGEVLQQRNSTK
jgi:hypothetical protein